MSRSPSQPVRRLAAASCAVLLTTALAACGDDSGEADDSPSSPETSAGTTAETSADASADASGGSAAGAGELAEVSFTGEVGEGLTATWKSAVEAPESTTVTTLVEGDGETVADGDTVTTYLWVGNGTTQEDVYSDYDNGAPEAIPNDEQVGEVFRALLADATYGSRVAAVTTARELFGPSVEDNQLGVGVEDTVVVVADLVEKQAVAPTPTDDSAQDAPAESQPEVVEEGGEPVGLDFEGIDEPALDTPVQRVVLEEGTGPAVKDSDTVTVDYLGATYDAAEPFDESYSAEPLTSELSGLIQGWSIGLTGVPVGSRVLLQIPPAFGYGAQGSPPSIPGNATLWFVIDVLEAK